MWVCSVLLKRILTSAWQKLWSEPVDERLKSLELNIKVMEEIVSLRKPTGLKVKELIDHLGAVRN